MLSKCLVNKYNLKNMLAFCGYDVDQERANSSAFLMKLISKDRLCPLDSPMIYLEHKKEKGQAERGTKKICTGLRLQTPSKVCRLLVGSHSFNHSVYKDIPPFDNGRGGNGQHRSQCPYVLGPN